MPKKKLEEEGVTESPKKAKIDTTINKFFQSTKKKVEEKTEEGKEEEKKEEETTEIEKTGTVVDHLTDPSWRKALANEFQKPYFKSLIKKVDGEIQSGKEVFPPPEDVFTAFNLTPLKSIKAVIIGQDPYHDNNQAHGLSFSVRKGVAIPPSLRNIYQELSTDIPGFKIPKHGNLESWAQQGVLLLNATLTVEAHKANSHEKYGWQEFTSEVIRVINKECEGVVFLLWGGFAKKKGSIINKSKHFVVESAHPSPLSVTKWRGCKCFSKANELLKKNGREEIDWTVPL